MKKIVLFIMSLAITFNASFFAQAEELPLSTEKSIDEFISTYEIDENLISTFKESFSTTNVSRTENNDNIIIGTYEDSILRVKRIAEAYNYTKKDVSDYINALIATPTTIVRKPSTNVRTETNFLNSLDYPNSSREGDYGIGYEVRSISGFSDSFASLTLPTVSINTVASNTSAYMFFSFEDTLGTIDVGLWYHGGDGGWRWRDFYSYDFSGNKYQSTATGPLNVSAGDELCLIAYITYDNYGERYVRCQIVDDENKSVLYSDFSVWIGNNIHESSCHINRQITLCNTLCNFSTGEYMHGAEFRDAFLYSINYPYGVAVSPNFTDNSRCGRFGKVGDDYLKVNINHHLKWDTENIDIDFTAD